MITNSGPGVTMARQERFATEAHMTATGAPAEAVAGALATQDALIALVRAGADIETVQAAAGEDGHGPGVQAFQARGQPVVSVDTKKRSW